jgi:hypothetical protein
MTQSSFINDPTHWRERAEEMRALAEGMHERETVETFLKLAADYDKLERNPIKLHRSRKRRSSWRIRLRRRCL